MLRKHNWNTFTDTTCTAFASSTFNEVEGDNKDLYTRLVFASGDENFEYYELAKNLLQRLKDMHCSKDRKLDALKLLSNMINIESMELISK